ncbi:MAG: nitroreductase [Thermodesulfobacteriota bacterium]|nr:nitroreductase [Thermodesulfobacteriota bacterium]
MLNIIKSRRSIRKFSPKEVEEEKLKEIIEAGIWAPSGLNNQPWRVAIIKDKEIKKSLSLFTRYGRIIDSSSVCIVVFLDNSASYNRVKDIQAVGAFLQNMLLAAHQLSLGSVWLGEILNNRDKVEELLNVPEGYELMAVVALGYPAESPVSNRKPLKEIIFLRK